MKNKKRGGGGGGGMGVKRDGDLLLKLSSTEKDGLFERGGINRGFKSISIVCKIAIQNVFSTSNRFDF